MQQFALGAETTKGPNAGMSAEQTAGWFALPGESGVLAERLGTDREGWEATTQGYYSDVLNRYGRDTGLEKIYQTPAWGAVLTSAATKATSRVDPITGVGGVPGAETALRAFAGSRTEGFQANLQAGMAFNELSRRGRGSNLRNLTSGMINKMVQRFPETSIFGKAARTLARGLNVPFEAPDEIDAMYTPLPEKARGEAEYFQTRRFNQARQQGYEGSLEDFQTMERDTTRRQVERSAAGQRTMTETEKYTQLVQRQQSGDITPEEATEMRAMEQSYAPQQGGAGAPPPTQPPAIPVSGEPPGRKPKRARTAKPVAQVSQETKVGETPVQVDDWVKAYGPDKETVMWQMPRSDWEGGGMSPRKGGKPSVRATEAAVGETPYKPPDIQTMSKPDTDPQRIGYSIRERMQRISSYMKTKPSMTSKVHEVLEQLGYRGEETTESVRTRAERARIEEPERFFGAFTSGELMQGASLATLQQDIAYSYAFRDRAPGRGMGRTQDIDRVLAEATDTSRGLGQDVSSLGYLFKDFKGVKPQMLRSAKAIQNAPAFQALRSRMEQKGLFTAEEFGTQQISALKNIMAEGGISQEEMASAMGIDLKTATPEQIEQVKQATASQPSFKQILGRTAGLTTDKNINTYFPQVGAVGAVGAAYKKAEGASSLGKTDYIDMAAEKIATLNSAYKAQTEALDKLNRIQEKGTLNTKEGAKAQEDYAAASAKYKAVASGYISESAQKQLGVLQAQISTGGGAVSTDQLTRMGKLLGTIDKSEKQQAESQQQYSELTAPGQEKWGSAARRMLGGFGLMYMRSIGNFATSGWGFGQEQRMAFDQAGAQGAYQSLGTAAVPYNQQSILKTNQALYGTAVDPRTSFQAWTSRTPVARDVYNVGAAGVGTWGYTQFAASQLGLNTPSGAALAKAALPLGVVAGAASMFIDADARRKDPQALAYRQATEKMGITDYAALGMMGMTEYAGYAGREQTYKSFNTALQSGAPIENLMQKDFKSMGMSQKELAEYPLAKQKELLEKSGSYSLSQTEKFFLTSRAVAERFQGYTPEAQIGATSFLMRSGGSETDKGLENIISDVQMGGWAQQTALGGMKGLGFKASAVYGKQGAGFQQYLADQTAQGSLNEAAKMSLTAGVQRAAQLPGVEYMKGIGALGGTFNADKATKFLTKLEQLSDSNFTVLQTQMQAYQLQRQNGMAGAQAPDVNKFVTATEDERGRLTYQAKEFTPQQTAQMQREATAQVSVEQGRQNLMQRYQTQTAMYGNAPLGGRVANLIQQVAPNRNFMTERLLGGDSMVMSMLAAERPEVFNQLQGPVNIQGQQFSPNTMATADRDLSGQRLTGLGQYRTSLWQGTQTPQQVGQRIFGGMGGAGVQAAVGGVQLPNGGITLSNGQQVSQVGGTMGIQWAQNLEQYQYQQAQIAQQRKGLGQDYAYQMQMWGLQDRQRNLGVRHQMAQFGFQEQGMQLQQQGAEMSNRFFWQNAGMQQQQTQTQRGWQRQDWQIQGQTRAMQWGWQQEDFQEEKRFMTGRQRRLAERQQERAGITHNLEDEQIGRQKERTQELWKMEDERFEASKQQHAEQYSLTLKQMELQKKEFEEQKKFYLESKKIEDEIIKLQRQHWLEQHKLSEEQLALTEQHVQKTLELQQASDLLNTAMEMEKGLLNTLAEDSMMKFIESISKLTDVIAPWLSGDNTVAENADDWGSSNYSDDGTVPPQVTQFNNPYVSTTTTQRENFHQRAGGGEWTSAMFNTIKTGEKGWEYIIGNQVVPHEQSVALEQAGVMPGTPTGQARSMMERPQYTGTTTDWSSLVPTVLPGSGGRSAASRSRPATIIVQIGNEELKRFVVDVVGDEF